MLMLFRQVLPTSAAPENPQNSFGNTTVLAPRAAALVVLGGTKGAIFFRCTSLSGGSDRVIGPASGLPTSFIPHLTNRNRHHFTTLY